MKTLTTAAITIAVNTAVEEAKNELIGDTGMALRSGMPKLDYVVVYFLVNSGNEKTTDRNWCNYFDSKCWSYNTRIIIGFIDNNLVVVLLLLGVQVQYSTVQYSSVA